MKTIMKTTTSNLIVMKTILMVVLMTSSLLAQATPEHKIQEAIQESTIAEDIYNIENPGSYIPIISEGRELDYRGIKLDAGIRYNIITDETFVHGISFDGSIAASLDNVHEFGGAMSWGTFSLNSSNPIKASYGWDTKIGFLYRFNIRYHAFAFSLGLQTGPAIFNYKKDSVNGDLYYFYYIQPEVDFELRLLEHFALSFTTGYALHLPMLGVSSPFVSHLTFGLTWRWYEID